MLNLKEICNYTATGSRKFEGKNLTGTRGRQFFFHEHFHCLFQHPVNKKKVRARKFFFQEKNILDAWKVISPRHVNGVAMVE